VNQSTLRIPVGWKMFFVDSPFDPSLIRLYVQRNIFSSRDVKETSEILKLLIFILLSPNFTQWYILGLRSDLYNSVSTKYHFLVTWRQKVFFWEIGHSVATEHVTWDACRVIDCNRQTRPLRHVSVSLCVIVCVTLSGERRSVKVSQVAPSGRNLLLWSYPENAPSNKRKTIDGDSYELRIKIP
jgi:hypothetical protein